MTEFNPIINFIWSVADDVLRDVYVKGKYRDVILPMTVIRRIDVVLEPSKPQVLATYKEYKDKLDNLGGLLTSKKQGSGHAFYNHSPFTLKDLLTDPKSIRANFENYLNGFSPNVQDIINKFKFRNQLDTLEDAGILYQLVQKFCDKKIDLSPNALSNLGMGYVFEDLIRRFNEENNEEAGEHFTPREIIQLMTHLVFNPIQKQVKEAGTVLIYDPACGSGGMLTESKKYLTDDPESPVQTDAQIFLYGQEINPETYALCKADMMIKEEDPDKIAYGSTLSEPQFQDLRFDFMLTNPPYGKTWKTDQDKLTAGSKNKKEINDSRFLVDGTPALPRVNDGQLLFLMHMISKMKHDTPLGSRIASVHNGSALFTGDAGSGESEIRRHIIESDYLECIIGLPKEMFYNTGIATYVWVLSNRKPKHRKGKVQLIDATGEAFFSKMSKSLGMKRNQFLAQHIELIDKTFADFKETDYSKIFDNEDFGFRQITVERPLLDADGNPVTDKKGNPKPDSSLRDTENIPLKEDVQTYFEREVLPYAPDAYIDEDKTKIGYEISFTRYFYQYKPLRSLDAISNELWALENETEGLLKQILG